MSNDEWTEVCRPNTRHFPVVNDRKMRDPKCERESLCREDVRIVSDLASCNDFYVDQNLIRPYQQEFLSTLRSDIGKVRNGTGFVAFNEDDELIGFAICYDTQRQVTESVFEITSLFVRPDYRGVHIGFHLFKMCEREAFSRLHRTIAISIPQKCRDTLQFWEKMGFSKDRTTDDRSVITMLKTRI